MKTHSAIEHVSDTALWVAHYRALESARTDALFRDPFAKKLAGDKGRIISESMGKSSRYTAWTLAIRTRIIDEFILHAVAQGVDTILNLGAGLDTRPYRLDLPPSLSWIEVDHAALLDYKEPLLAGEKPRCQLTRIRLDLADGEKRRQLLFDVAKKSRNILVLTEGVIPYLSEDHVAELARDLKAHSSFRFWIAEYFSPSIYRYFQARKRRAQMRNAPFRFFPKDWFAFFEKEGWTAKEVKYLAEESMRLERKMPKPWWTIVLWPLSLGKRAQKYLRFSGYVLFAPK